MAYFQSKNPNLGKFWRALQWNMLVYLMASLYFYQICIVCGHLVDYMVVWYIFPRFGMMYQEKSGNPDMSRKKDLSKIFLTFFKFTPYVALQGCQVFLATSYQKGKKLPNHQMAKYIKWL
jgi:hypothetical protein